MNTIQTKLQQLEKALEICNAVFETNTEWQTQTEEDKLRFAFYLMKAFQDLKQ